MREVCLESSLIAIAGGALGLLLLRAILDFATVDFQLFGTEVSLEPHVDGPALALAAAALLVSILVFGIEPALKLTRDSVRSDLCGGDTAVGVPQSGRQRAFIRWQVAISATFLLIAAILAKVVVAELRHDPGIDLERLSVATVPFDRKWDTARSQRVLLAAVDRLRREQTLESVAISSGVPFGVTGTPFALMTQRIVHSRRACRAPSGFSFPRRQRSSERSASASSGVAASRIVTTREPHRSS